MTLIDKYKHKLLDFARYTYKTHTNTREKQNLTRFKQAKNKKSKTQIKHELSALKAHWGCIPLQYYAHDMYLNTCTLTIEEMKKYIPPYYFYKLIFPQYDDVNSLLPLFEDKIVMHTLFKGMQYPSTMILAIKKRQTLFDEQGNTLTDKSLEQLLSTTDCEKLFIKPVDGRGGQGILIAKKKGNGFFIDNAPLTLDVLKKLSGDYILEPGIKQASVLNAVYPHSVNTLRAITKRKPCGEIEIVAITLRMGTSGREIDNCCAGGILIGIDLDTGKALKPYATYEFGAERFYQHPDTEFEFEQLVIPNWQALKNQLINLAKRNALINLIGWDLALTEDGVNVIEINTLFGLDLLQAALGGLSEQFEENTSLKL